jgi:hypothetical protein
MLQMRWFVFCNCMGLCGGPWHWPTDRGTASAYLYSRCVCTIALQHARLMRKHTHRGATGTTACTAILTGRASWLCMYPNCYSEGTLASPSPIAVYNGIWATRHLFDGLRRNHVSILTFLLYGAEHHSSGHKLCSHLRVSQHFMEPEGSLQHSQELSDCPNPESDQSSSHQPHSIYTRPILMLSTHLRLRIPSCLFPSGFPTNNIHVPRAGIMGRDTYSKCANVL